MVGSQADGAKLRPCGRVLEFAYVNLPLSKLPHSSCTCHLLAPDQSYELVQRAALLAVVLAEYTYRIATRTQDSCTR